MFLVHETVVFSLSMSFPLLLVFWLLCRVTGCACMKDLARVLGFDVASFPAIVLGLPQSLLFYLFFLGGWLWFLHAGTYQ